MYTGPDEKPPAYSNLGYETLFNQNPDQNPQNTPPVDTPAQPTSTNTNPQNQPPEYAPAQPTTTETMAASIAQEVEGVAVSPALASEAVEGTTACVSHNTGDENSYATIIDTNVGETAQVDTSDA